jgi:hypothetical protein
MSNVQLDGSFSASSGRPSIATLRSRISLEFHRFNYVIYENLGQNLQANWASYFLGLLSNRSNDFWFIQTRDHLANLFGCNYADIPNHYKPLISESSNRYIYFFIPTPNDIRGIPDRIIELHYTNSRQWYSSTYVYDDESGEWVEHSQEESNNNYFSLALWEIREAYSIAFPASVVPDTVNNIFIDYRVRQAGAFRQTRDLCNIRITAESGDARRALVFDPAHIIERTVSVCNYHTRFMKIVDARIPLSNLGRLTQHEQDTRVKGILLCLCKNLAMADSSVRNDIDSSRLDTDFNRIADYGRRKSNFFDNVYNFLNHPILERLEHCLLLHRVGDLQVDGYIWILIISPLVTIAGEHQLLAHYFQEVSSRSTGESAWSSFFHDSLRRDSVSESRTVSYWKSAMQGIQVANLAVAIADIRSFILVNAYTSGEINWSNFQNAISRDSARLVRAAGGSQAAAVREIRRIFRHANTITRFAAIANGDISGSTFTSALTSLGDFADTRNLKYIATRASALKNTYNIFENSTQLVNRIGVNDWDAAFGRGISLAAGITEFGYILATGTTIGGPVGAIVAIVGVLGAVIVVFGTDSNREILMRLSTWGNNPYEDIRQQDWMSSPPRLWSNTRIGMERQLESLINLLHRYEVRHNYQNLRWGSLVSNILALDILTNFLPDTVKFEFKAEFTHNRSRATRINFSITFPPRVRPRTDRDSTGAFSRVNFRQIDQRIVSSINSQLFTDSGRQRIRLHIVFADNITRSNGWNGEAWLKCYPFGHSEFSAPHGNYAFHLENLISHDNLIINHWRDYSFERDEWSMMPSW